MNPLYLVIGAVLLLGGGKWETPAIFQKKPPTAQLVAAQNDLAAAKAAQAKAEAELARVEAERQARIAGQLDYAQQMASGTDLALRRVPAEHQSPEVKLAAEFAQRAVAGFEAARGKLSAQQRAEIEGLFSTAMAAKDAEAQALRAALAGKDADLQAQSAARAALEQKIPLLEADVTTARAATGVVSAKVDSKTAEVALYANTAAAEKARAGGLDAYAGNLVRILIALGVLYGLVHYALPSLAQEFPGNRVLGVVNQAVKSIASSHL